MTGPDRIWLEPTGIREGWTGLPHQVVDGDVEYIRRDPAAIAALPEVQALIRQAVEACAQVADGWQNETGTDIAAAARICPQIAAAIRKRGEG